MAKASLSLTISTCTLYTLYIWHPARILTGNKRTGAVSVRPLWSCGPVSLVAVPPEVYLFSSWWKILCTQTRAAVRWGEVEVEVEISSVLSNHDAWGQLVSPSFLPSLHKPANHTDIPLPILLQASRTEEAYWNREENAVKKLEFGGLCESSIHTSRLLLIPFAGWQGTYTGMVKVQVGIAHFSESWDQYPFWPWFHILSYPLASRRYHPKVIFWFC